MAIRAAVELIQKRKRVNEIMDALEGVNSVHTQAEIEANKLLAQAEIEANKLLAELAGMTPPAENAGLAQLIDEATSQTAAKQDAKAAV